MSASTQAQPGLPQQQFESYKKIRVLGKGSFGKAFLVQAESDGVSTHLNVRLTPISCRATL